MSEVAPQIEQVILENEDVKTEMVAADGSNIKQFRIVICDEHQQALIAALAQRRICTQPNILKASHALFALAARTIGTVDLVRHRCPVCGLAKFDYVNQMVIALTTEGKKDG